MILKYVFILYANMVCQLFIEFCIIIYTNSTVNCRWVLFAPNSLPYKVASMLHFVTHQKLRCISHTTPQGIEFARLNTSSQPEAQSINLHSIDLYPKCSLVAMHNAWTRALLNYTQYFLCELFYSCTIYFSLPQIPRAVLQC